MDKSELTIYSVYHKPSIVPVCDFIEPLQVGHSCTDIDLGFTADSTGDNISSKNRHYCELTGLYWIWKNLNKIDSRYIGLCHYRRYFSLPDSRKSGLFKRKKIDQRPAYIAPLTEASLERACLTALKESLLQQLNSGAVIVPKAILLNINNEFTSSLKAHFIYNHIKEDWVLMEQTVKKLFPEYERSWSDFEKHTKMHCCNMFIADKTFIDNYCKWLFAIESELEKVVKISEYEYQSRLYGFFSERLLNLYLLHNQISTVQFPVLELT